MTNPNEAPWDGERLAREHCKDWPTETYCPGDLVGFYLAGSEARADYDRGIAEAALKELKEAAYKDDAGCFIPMEYIVGAFKHTASDYKEGNKSRRSLKTVAAGIFRPVSERAHILGEDGNPIKDFDVDIRRATNHRVGAVAVCRPRFDRWKVRFAVAIDDTMIAMTTAQSILEDAGKRAGIGSFRVSKGGYFGQFRVTQWKEIQ